MMDNLKKLGRSMAFQFSHFRQSLQQGMRIRRDQWYALFRLFTHPIDALNDIKYEGKASLTIANLLAALFFLEQLFAEVATGYLYGVQEADRRSVLMILVSTIGLLLLWSICNWATCTLFDGEGSFREIWIMTAYSLLPWVVISPIVTMLSNISSQDEALLIGTVRIIGIGWTLLLLFLGVMVCQQFTVTKTVVLIVVTVLAIAILLFLVLLFFSIGQQMVNFVKNIFLELTL